MGCLTATTATVRERRAGTLPLLVASPTSPLVVLMGRSTFFVANGVAFSVGALAGFLPVTHGLDAVRELLGEGRPGAVLTGAGLELPVGAGWLVASLVTFRRLAEPAGATARSCSRPPEGGPSRQRGTSLGASLSRSRQLRRAATAE